jgi:hypothetical protein
MIVACVNVAPVDQPGLSKRAMVAAAGEGGHAPMKTRTPRFGQSPVRVMVADRRRSATKEMSNHRSSRASLPITSAEYNLTQTKPL